MIIGAIGTGSRIMRWVVYTKREGRWAFTLAESPEAAIERFFDAAKNGRILSLPTTDNKIWTAPASEADVLAYRSCRR